MTCRLQYFLTASKAVLPLLLVFACGCGGKLVTPPEELLSVQTQVVKYVDHERRESLTGEFRARIQSDLSFRVSGRIATRAVEVGDRVKPGDVLATMDTLKQRADVTAAQAGVRSAEATLAQTEADMKRIEALLPSKAASQAEFDDAKAAYLTAQGSVNIAKFALDHADTQLSFTDLRANANGVIIARYAEVGQVVSSAQAVFTVAEDGDREVVFDVFQSHIPDRPLEDKVSLTLISNPSVKANGVIREIAPSIDETSGTVRVKVAVPNPPEQMALGAPVLGEAIFTPTKVAELPWTVLMREGESAAVWVVDPNNKTVKLQVIEVVGYDTTTMLVTSGLSDGDIVVTQGAQLLRSGQHVSIVSDETKDSSPKVGVNP